MSGIGSASTGSNVTVGTNVPPVSFPGIASGIDYNSIIQKYTDLTLAQETPLKTKVTALNNQQTELLKIQDLISKFQDTFTAISDPANFSATTPTSSNTSAIAASSVSGSVATPGTYTVTAATLATATQITNDPAANGTFDQTKTLATAGASITPDNGPAGYSGQGSITINGLTLHYDVNSTTLQSFISTNAAALSSVGVTLSYNAATQKVTVSSTQPLTLGSATDSGNLLQVLKLDTAQIAQGGGTYTAVSTGAVGGINVGATLNTANNAGFATAVTAGKFSINGVTFTVDPTVNNVNDLLNQINASAAGVIATYDQSSDKIVLTAKNDGPQGITLGSSGDTSNFLQAAGFLANYTQPALSGGATINVGKSAAVTYTDNAGASHTVFSNSNDVTDAVPGVDLKLQQAVGGGSGVAPVTISVAQDNSALTTAINTFVTAYNNVINEINTATQAPVIGSTTSSTTGQTSGTQLTTGGVLFNNQDVLALKDQLVGLVSGFGQTGSSSYNSLASIGLTLDSSFTVDSASSSDTSNTTSQNDVSTQTFAGTSGRLNTLDTTKLSAALAANPSAVSKLFTGTSSIVGQLGSYLTSVSGLPTQLTGAVAGSVPPQSLFSTLSTQTSDQITSLQQQISLVTDQANLQADQLRQEFVNSETQIAQLQSLQSSLGSLVSSSKA
ncbi:MAG: flagellar filament capping protein FliD [Candidatus Eremiobacteraeota bacterium]|nr:flagellar filament capping protein FliD [Candidatus Eremiobacteraeota bacterium]